MYKIYNNYSNLLKTLDLIKIGRYNKISPNLKGSRQFFVSFKYGDKKMFPVGMTFEKEKLIEEIKKFTESKRMV